MTWKRTIVFNLYYHPLTNIYNISLSEVSVFKAFLVRIFPHLDWIRRDTLYLSAFSPNAGKYGPQKLRIQTLFTHCICIKYIVTYKILTYSLNSTVAISKIIDKPDVKLLFEKGNFRTFFLDQLDKIILLV